MRPIGGRGSSASRTVRGIAVALSTAFLLAACQSPPVTEFSGEPVCATEGAASNAVEAGGEFGTVPQVTFPEGLTAATTDRSVIIEGDGAVAGRGSLVTVDYMAFNARTGVALEATSYGADGVGHTLLTLATEESMPGLRRALLCTTVGSRVAAVVPAGDGLGQFGAAFGLASDDAVVFVFDLIAVAADRAGGEPQPPVEGLPAVEPQEDGEPVITVPVVAPPAARVVHPLRVGSGLVVREGADVAVRYRAVVWRNGLVFEENWSRIGLELRSHHDFLPGVDDALVGQTVGSQLLIVVPPELGYGPSGFPSKSITGTDTLVFVVDILATT